MSMIYRAGEGEDVQKAAEQALKHNCKEFLIDDTLYSVEVKIKETGKIISTA